MKIDRRPRLIQGLLMSEVALAAAVFAMIAFGYSKAYVRYGNLVVMAFAATWFIEFYVLRPKRARKLGNPLKIEPLIGVLLLAVFMGIYLFFEPREWRFVVTYSQVCVLAVIVFNLIRMTGRTWPIEIGMCLAVVYMFLLVSDDIAAAAANQQRLRVRIGDDIAGLNPNTYGSILNFQVIFFLRYFFQVFPTVRRGYMASAILVLGGIASLIAAYQILVILGSRQHQLWLMASILSIVLLSGRGQVRVGKIITSVVLVGILGGVSIWLIRESPFVERFVNAYYDLVEGTATQENSSRERLNMIKVGLELWRSSPIIGLGNHGFEANSIYATYSHNQYVELNVNYGLLGFALFYSLHLLIIRKAYYMWFAGSLSQKANAVWLVVVIGGVMLSNLFLPSYHEKIFGMVLAVLAGIAYQPLRYRVTSRFKRFALGSP